MSRLYIYCNGGLGSEVYQIAVRNGFSRDAIYFIDDSCYDDISVFSYSAFLAKYTKSDSAIVAHGEPNTRQLLFNKLVGDNVALATLVDPSVVIYDTAIIGRGSIICPNCIVSSNTVIHENVLVNASSIVGHDVQLSPHVVLSSMVNIGGSTKVFDNAFVGMGCLVREGISLQHHSICSMGAVVHRDVDPHVVVQGDPARPRLMNHSGKIFKS